MTNLKDTHQGGGTTVPVAEDSLEDLNAEIRRNRMGAYWMDDHTTPPPEQGSMWKWSAIRPLLNRAANIHSLNQEGSSRRNIAFRDQFDRGIGMGVQHVAPGEIALSHRHTPSALRFVVEGNENAFTTVDGERVMMLRGDLIYTPNWSFHSHHNEGSTDLVWLDMLDSQLVRFLHAAFFEEEAESTGEWDETKIALPVVRYPWTEVEKAFDAQQGIVATPGDGDAYFYAPPGKESALPTIGNSMNRIRSGTTTPLHRHTSTHVFHVFEGNGSSVVGDKEFEWERGDCFNVPAWLPHSHSSAGTDDSWLYSVDNKPVLKALHLYREQL